MSECPVCPYCGELSEYVDSAEVYGHSYGMLYLCRPCNAYVGVHRGTSTPLGTLANEELRRWRNKAHLAFDPLWKQRGMRRKEAYAFLAGKLGIDRGACHIAMFDVAQCRQTVDICLEYMAV